MRAPMSVWKVTVMVPALLVSGLLWLMMLVVLPPALGLLGFLACGALVAVLAIGGLEGQAVRLLTGSRAATEAELAVLAPVLHTHGTNVLPDVVAYVRRAPGAQTPPALVVGRSSLVVTPWLVEATYRGRISREEAAALVAHAGARHDAGRHRREVAVLAFTTPWRVIIAVARRVGGVFGWFPFMRFAWSIRGVVGAVAVVQSVMEGRAPAGVLAGVFVALTYLVPAAARARELELEAEADRRLVARGLGQVLAGLLRRFGAPVSIARLQRLENRPTEQPAQTAPVLPLAAFSPN
jgi:hypothetical protein